MNSVRLPITIAMIFVFIPLIAFTQNAYINFEGKQTNPLRLSADGSKLFAVNTPDARLSVFDVSSASNPLLIAEIPVGIEPVSVNPRTPDEVWVVNEISDSISVVSVSKRIVTDTIYTPDEPADVVFARGKAFVSAARKNQILVFDVTNHVQLATIPVFGENPRAMALSPDGMKVYAAFALSGNHTTLIPAGIAPPQPPPTNTNLPAPPTTGLIVDASDPVWTNVIKFKMPDNDVVEIDADSMTITRYFTNVGTINLGLAVRPDNGDLYVANTEALNLVRFEPALRGHLVDNRITQITTGTGARTFYDLNPSVNYSVLPNLEALTNALAQPTALAFDPSGNFFFVAAFGTDRIARMSPNGNILARIELGAVGSMIDTRNMRGPRGLALKAPAQRLYVLNRISNSLSLIDTANDRLLKEIPVGSHNPTPSAIRNGRGFLYDAKLSGNGTASCASCHVDSEMDMLAWDLGNPDGEMKPVPVFAFTNSFGNFPISLPAHPMKGPLMTQTLRGLLDSEPFHWRGDKTNFLDFNVTFDTLLGGDTLADAEMIAFRDFINTIPFQSNPNVTLNGSLPLTFEGSDPVRGQADFDNAVVPSPLPSITCATCHGIGTTDSDDRVRLAQDAQTFQSFKTPHLKILYQKLNFNHTPGVDSVNGFGLMHDGERAGVLDFLSRPFFDPVAGNMKTNIAAFLKCFDTGTPKAIGYARTLAATNVNESSVSGDWSTLESNARNNSSKRRIDLIVKGTLDSVPHGLLYEPSSGSYLVDSTNIPALTRAQLTAKVLAGDTLTIMGVPRGAGSRMGMDRDANGVRDADEPKPRLQVIGSGSGVVLSWPHTAVGYRIEATTNLSAAFWSTVSNPVEIVGIQNIQTNDVTGSARFFRLSSP